MDPLKCLLMILKEHKTIIAIDAKAQMTQAINCLFNDNMNLIFWITVIVNLRKFTSINYNLCDIKNYSSKHKEKQ